MNKKEQITIKEQTLIMFSGLPASGKSTMASEIYSKTNKIVRVNKDLLRKMLNFKNYSQEKEDDMNHIRYLIISYYLTKGFSVIIDDTNIQKKYLEKYKDIAIKFNVKFIHIILEEPINILIDRDKIRPNSVGSKVIKSLSYKYDISDYYSKT